MKITVCREHDVDKSFDAAVDARYSGKTTSVGRSKP